MTTKYQKQEKKYKEEEKRNVENPLIHFDKKSIIHIALFFCFIIIGYFAVTMDFQGYFVQHNPNWTTATGQVQSIDKIVGMEQTRAGNQITTIGYKIKYCYIINGIKYEQKYIYGKTKTNLREFVNFVKPLDNVEIYYEKKDPKNSYINININSDFYKKEKLKQ